MAIGLIGRKRGMTRVFTDAGASLPVSVIEVEGNRITQIKDMDADGYRAVQVTTGARRASRVTKPMTGHFKKAGTEAGRGLWEFRLGQNDDLPRVASGQDGEHAKGSDQADQTEGEGETPETAEIRVGDALTVQLFEVGQKVDVVGTSIGKGYAGTIKRHNFRGQRNTHGNSKAHRAPGSIGQNQTPGRVFKGKKMAGQLGNRRKTIQNLEIIRVDADRNLLLVKGGVPGADGGDLMILPSVKAR